VIEELLGPLSAVRLIRGIDPKQAAFLEAIGFGLDTVDLVYRRLAAMLRGLDPAPSPLVFADAWAIVDWMDRIDTLVEHCPGLSPRDEAVRDFLNTSSLVDELRNIYEHPLRELPRLVPSGGSLWGRITWQRRVDGGHELMEITPFSRWREVDERRPADEQEPPRADIDRISLFSPDGAVEIGITGQWEAAVRFGLRLDGALQAGTKPEEGERMDVRLWLPAPSAATWPELEKRLA
jgi:hypothetical protein